MNVGKLILKYLCIIITLFLASSVHADTVNQRAGEPQQNQYEKIAAELDNLQAQLEALSHAVDLSKSKTNENTNAIREVINSAKFTNTSLMKELKLAKNSRKNLEEGLENLHGDVVTIDNSLKDISVSWSQASEIAKLGALILLGGLLIEIIGATVLAGTHLATEQKDVFTLASTPGAKDLSMRDINSEPRIDFLGSIASVMLFLGFVLQFSGTTLVLSLPLWLTITMVTLSVVPGSLVLYYLLGQSYNQSRTEKLKVIFKNIKRNLFPVFGAKCAICSKRVNFKSAYVFWALDPNSEKHPYLHTPYNMHFGHYACLSASGKYGQPKNRNNQLPPIEIHKCHIKEFIINEVPKMKVWWDNYRAHWAEEQELEENLCNSEYTFIQILKEVQKLKPNKHLRANHLSTSPSLK